MFIAKVYMETEIEQNAFEPLAAFWENMFKWITVHQSNLLWFALGIACSVIIAYIVSWFIRTVLHALVKRTESNIDDMLLNALHRPLLAALIVSGFVVSINFLKLPANVSAVVRSIYFLLMVLCVTAFLLRIVNVWREFMLRMTSRTETKFDDLLIGLLSPLFKAVIWVIAVLFVAENVFKFNITAMLTGAGIAAMAIAFAAQNTIANIFGAVTLSIDRPFQIGDLIKVNDKLGAVVVIGLRSTHIRSLDGTLWVIPNKEMAEATIENITARPNIKHIFNIGVVYSTSPEKVRRAIEIVREILENHPLTDMEKNPPLVTFESLRDWSLNIQAVEWFQTGDFVEYNNARDEVNFEVLRRFNAENIEFAFPSQSIYVEKSGN